MTASTQSSATTVALNGDSLIMVLEDDIAFDKMQKSLSDKRMDFYRNFEFTEPSDTSDVRR